MQLKKTQITQPPEQSESRNSQFKSAEDIAVINFLALLSERNTFPDKDPVDKICRSPIWMKLDDQFSASMGSISSYYSEQGEVKLIIGGTGSSEIFSLVVEPAGNSEVIIKKLNEVIELTDQVGRQDGIGDTMTLYIARSSGEDLGIISFIEPTNKELIGEQLVLSFMSKSRAVEEDLWPRNRKQKTQKSNPIPSRNINEKNYTASKWKTSTSTNPIIGNHTQVTYGNFYENGELLLKTDEKSIVMFIAMPTDEKDMVNLGLILMSKKRVFPSVTVQQLANKSQIAYSRKVQVSIDGSTIRPIQQPLRYSINNGNFWLNSLGATLSPQKILSANNYIKIRDPNSGYSIQINDLGGLKKMINDNKKNRTAF